MVSFSVLYMRINETTTGCKTNQPTIEKTMSKTQKSTLYWSTIYFTTLLVVVLIVAVLVLALKNAVFVVNTFLYLIRVCGRIEKKKLAN